ncbi:MAG: SusD/RagB family nutrient-binding outer membrane lipoprotein [Cyclobacteriaceae bacterium]
MKRINQFKLYIIVPLLMFMGVGCGEEFLNINDNPNNPIEASLDLLLPGAQLGAAWGTTRVAWEDASIFSRHFYDLGESAYNVNTSQYPNDWDAIFARSLKEFSQIVSQGEAEDKVGFQGIAKVQMAYLFGLAVDLWGDIPFTEALDGENNLFPAFDDDASVYDNIFIMLDDAKVNLDSALARGEQAIASDLVYGGGSGTAQYTNWKRAANTIKLKMLLNTRMVDPGRATTEINALITEDLLISSNSQNFTFVWGESDNPLNRHPMYQQEYGNSGDKDFYMDNYFMWKLHSKNDPRIRYYIYRQGTFDGLTFDTTPCSSRTDCAFWNLISADPEADGLLGRDHGDPSGIPGDNEIRATFGVYPIGGSYDDDAREERTIDLGGKGAGITPWLTSSMRAFMLAEAALVLGATGDTKALFLEGISESMEHVSDFSLSVQGANAVPMDQDEVDAYMADREADFDNASSEDVTLNVIIEEKYFAEFGNGFESYNDIRRTGFPADLPTSLAPQGPFPLRFPYSVDELTANPNAPDPAPLLSEPIFWDVN